MRDDVLIPPQTASQFGQSFRKRHGIGGKNSELLKLGYEVAQSTVSEYMARGGKPPTQSWKTFLRNHAEAIAAVQLLNENGANNLRDGSQSTIFRSGFAATSFLFFRQPDQPHTLAWHLRK